MRILEQLRLLPHPSRQVTTRLIALIALGAAIPACGAGSSATDVCRDALEVATTWVATLPSPDGHWLATACSQYGAGPGTAWAATSVYLSQPSRPPVEVLAFDQQVIFMHVAMKWLTPTHFEVSYGPRTPGDVIGANFQAVKLAGIDITLRHIGPKKHG